MPSAPRPRAAIYARFSTDRQNERSAEDQVRVCRERAEREGYDVVGVYPDLAISGATYNRPGLNSLLVDASAGAFDVVVSEAIDRISRNQADIATIYQRLQFADVRILTLSEGEINELHIGLKGTMSALFLKDLGDKIKRGQRGRMEAGRIPGGRCYGYDNVRMLDARGEPDRGIRAINPEQAVIVNRVYDEYLSGRSPRDIAHRLNADRVPSATGGEWRANAITGSRARQIGVLYNPIYNGRFAFNRVRMVVDPVTRKRVSRTNPQSEWIVRDFPDLRIIDNARWARVQQMQEGYVTRAPYAARRARHLLSGLVRCGACGGSVTIVKVDRWGCVRHKDAGTCLNARRISTEALERRVLYGLQREMLAPDIVSEVVRQYHSERTRLRAAAIGDRAAAEKRLRVAKAAIARLVTAIETGAADFSEIQEAMTARRADAQAASAQLAEHEALPVIALHPHIAEAYRAKIEQLGKTIMQGDVAREAGLRLIRELVEAVELRDDPTSPDGVAIEVIGSLNQVLALATGKPTPALRTAMVVAEEGLEPPTRGL